MQNVFPTVRAITAANRQSDKSTWVTEWGQATGTGTGAVSELQQSAFIIEGLNFMSSQPGIGPIFMFTSKDWSTDANNSEFNFGLFRFDGTPKPVVSQLKARCGC